jgi:DNA-binding LytR/AlgR family response regulator
VALRSARSTELLSVDAIVFARSVGNYTLLATESSEHAVRAPLTVIVEVLQAFGLARIHRTSAVNIGHVRRLVGRGRHHLSVVLSTGVEVEVGRAYQRAIRAQLGARTQRSSR